MLFNRVVLYLPSYKFPCLFLSLLLVNMNTFSDTSYTEVIRSLHYCDIKYPSIVFMNIFKQASHVSQNDFIVYGFAYVCVLTFYVVCTLIHKLSACKMVEKLNK